MTLPVLICDDSGVAQKQLARSLPAEWDVALSFAKHGGEALEQLSKGKGDVLFLDLNMPVMDGYQTLKALAERQLRSIVIVVSGDIQAAARERVMALGAFDFIKKPVSDHDLLSVLKSAGIYSPVGLPVDLTEGLPQQSPSPAAESQSSAEKLAGIASVSELEVYREITNVAMGQAAALLAQLLDVFVVLPIPKVDLLELGDLKMALHATRQKESVSAVCQGFIGSGIAGEAMLLFHDASLQDIAELMQFEDELNKLTEQELIMDIASIMIGACVKGIADQLAIEFSQGHPAILGQHVDVARLLTTDQWNWKNILTIEVCYAVEGYNVQCDLLLLISEDSLPVLRNKVAYLLS